MANEKCYNKHYAFFVACNQRTRPDRHRIDVLRLCVTFAQVRTRRTFRSPTHVSAAARLWRHTVRPSVARHPEIPYAFPKSGAPRFAPVLFTHASHITPQSNTYATLHPSIHPFLHYTAPPHTHTHQRNDRPPQRVDDLFDLRVFRRRERAHGRQAAGVLRAARRAA